jgi:endonuclease/exonuclease/phosphatase family metal-dependent hydrolase
MWARLFVVRLRITAVAVSIGLALVAAPVAAPPAQAATTTITGLEAAHVAARGVGLRWDVTGENAYRVRFSTSSSMSADTDTWDVLGNYFEWTHLDANPTATSARLTPGRTYYFQVKAITDEPSSGDRENLSGYSSALKVTLPSSGVAELPPIDLGATPAGADSMYVSWRTRGPGVGYVLRYTDDPSRPVLQWKSIKTDTAGALVTGLTKSTKYYFRARVIDSAGKGISDYSSSAAPSASTPASTTSPRISLVSYNIRKASGSPSWASRRAAVAANILAQAPAVAALQEATPLTYKGRKQYDDIVDLLGSKYSLTTRTGSSGTKLVYDTTRLSVRKAGVKALTTLGSATRYASWAVFADKRSGQQFFVINTHLEPGEQVASYNDVRSRQAREVLALIDQNAGNLPVVVAGDMNSNRSASPDNGQYKVFTGAGYVDPIDNATASWASGRDATAEHTMDWEYNSANQLDRKARRTAYPVGTTIDYVYTSPAIRVATWRTVVSLDTSGSFVGTILSDHNLIAVNLHLPAG